MAPKESGLPTMRGVEHIGLTVPDLNEATNFLYRCLVVKLFIPWDPFFIRRTGLG